MRVHEVKEIERDGVVFKVLVGGSVKAKGRLRPKGMKGKRRVRYVPLKRED